MGDHEGTPNKADAEKYLVFVNDPQNQEEPAIEDHPRRDRQGRDRDDRRQVLPDLATAPQNISALYINDKFWLENLDAEPAVQRLGREVGFPAFGHAMALSVAPRVPGADAAAALRRALKHSGRESSFGRQP